MAGMLQNGLGVLCYSTWKRTQARLVIRLSAARVTRTHARRAACTGTFRTRERVEKRPRTQRDVYACAEESGRWRRLEAN